MRRREVFYDDPPTVAPNELVNPNGRPSGGNQYDDPYTSLFETLAKQQIARSSQPYNDPLLGDVLGLIKSRIGATNAMSAPGVVGNNLLGDFITQARQRVTELNQEPFSAPEEDRLRTGLKENIELDRTAGRQRNIEDISRRGMADTSGVLAELNSRTDRGADTNRTKAESDLAQFITNERNRRRSEATTITGQLAGAGAADAQLQAQQRATNANFDLNKGQQILSMAGMIAEIAAQQRGETRARESDVLTIAQSLSQLGPQRLALMLSTLNGTGGNDLNSIFGNTLNLSNANTYAQNNQQTGQANMMGGLSQILAYLAAQRK